MNNKATPSNDIVCHCGLVGPMRGETFWVCETLLQDSVLSSLAWIKLAVGRDQTVIPDDPSMSVSSIFADGNLVRVPLNSPAMAQPNTRPACQSCQPSRFLTPTSEFHGPPIPTDVINSHGPKELLLDDSVQLSMLSGLKIARFLGAWTIALKMFIQR